MAGRGTGSDAGLPNDKRKRQSRYTSGRNFEYKYKHDLERNGWTVFRTAGSHGKFDLIAVFRSDAVCKIRFIQLKRKSTGHDIERIDDEYIASVTEEYIQKIYKKRKPKNG